MTILLYVRIIGLKQKIEKRANKTIAATERIVPSHHSKKVRAKVPPAIIMTLQMMDIAIIFLRVVAKRLKSMTFSPYNKQVYYKINLKYCQ